MKRVRIKLIIIVLIASWLIILFSCDKPDTLSKIKYDYRDQGSLSLPIGKSKLSMQFMGVNLDTNWLKSPDSILSKLPAIKLNDTIPFDFITTVVPADQIKELRLFIQLINDFPMNDTLQLFLADKNKNITQKLTPIPIPILEATFNAGDTAPRIPTQAEVPPIIFNRKVLKNFKNVKYIIITATLKNDFTHKNLYKYFKNFYLHIEISLQADLDVPIN
jgi:hypothetical protein